VFEAILGSESDYIIVLRANVTYSEGKRGLDNTYLVKASVQSSCLSVQ